MEKAGLTNALIMVITLQASGNLVNSYIDHNYGVDTVETAGDRCGTSQPSLKTNVCLSLDTPLLCSEGDFIDAA